MSLDYPEEPPVCDYEGSDYQTRFWDQGVRQYEDRVEAIALGRLLPPEGELLLEIGAGAGRNTPRYSGFKKIILLDYSRTQLEQARGSLGSNSRYLYVVADVYRMPFRPGSFDAVTMIRTLHHMADAPRALRNQREVLQSGGVFILEYANKLHLKAILRFLTGRQSWSPFDLPPVEFASLNFDFHPAAVREWLREAGFRIDRQLTVSHFRIGWAKRHIPLNLLVKMDALAQLTGDWWQLSPSVFVRATAIGEKGMSPTSGAIFRCPSCQEPLPESLVGRPLEGKLPPDGAFQCPSCNHSWAFKNGIYIFK